jgi:hypothetical protein
MWRLLPFVLILACAHAPVPAVSAPITTLPEATTPIVASEGSRNGTSTPPPSVPDSPVQTGGLETLPSEPLLSIQPGFQPDPIIRHGMGGGDIPADTLIDDCPGFVAAQPSLVLKLDRPIPALRVLVHMQDDAILVVQLENGRVLCNDDSDGLDPSIETSFPAGRHRIWVGTYSDMSAPARYILGLTEQRGLSPHDLDGMAPTP